MTSESSHIAETAAYAIHHVPAEVTLLFTSLLVALIVSLAFEEKLHAKKSLIVGVFSVVCLLLGASVIPAKTRFSTVTSESSSLQSSQIRRARRWATMQLTDDATRKGSIPMLSRRLTVEGASLV